MKYFRLFLIISLWFVLDGVAFSQAYFDTSLHKTLRDRRIGMEKQTEVLKRSQTSPSTVQVWAAQSATDR